MIGLHTDSLMLTRSKLCTRERTGLSLHAWVANGSTVGLTQEWVNGVPSRSPLVPVLSDLSLWHNSKP